MPVARATININTEAVKTCVVFIYSAGADGKADTTKPDATGFLVSVPTTDTPRAVTIGSDGDGLKTGTVRGQLLAKHSTVWICEGAADQETDVLRSTDSNCGRHWNVSTVRQSTGSRDALLHVSHSVWFLESSEGFVPVQRDSNYLSSLY